ncbi:hypothetical protein [Kordiimonas laminariae]|uniref:hypothetical protein n=1 Tax=Kordiimonas laminariae TaxID=2917717 RepID=UPI001FF1AE22|nr:hypothetical protein [Kordiimonas laminariae]MCK0071125.1 hypothetical protein [Kordiimonas laminariae]
MPTVNLELQMKFLKELDEALADALTRYGDDGEEKIAELKYMKSEVGRACRIIAERMTDTSDKRPAAVAYGHEKHREAVFS